MDFKFQNDITSRGFGEGGRGLNPGEKLTEIDCKTIPLKNLQIKSGKKTFFSAFHCPGKTVSCFNRLCVSLYDLPNEFYS